MILYVCPEKEFVHLLATPDNFTYTYLRSDIKIKLQLSIAIDHPPFFSHYHTRFVFYLAPLILCLLAKTCRKLQAKKKESRLGRSICFVQASSCRLTTDLIPGRICNWKRSRCASSTGTTSFIENTRCTVLVGPVPVDESGFTRRRSSSRVPLSIGKKEFHRVREIHARRLV